MNDDKVPAIRVELATPELRRLTAAIMALVEVTVGHTEAQMIWTRIQTQLDREMLDKAELSR